MTIHKVPKICCIILAAGLSSRMGDFKPLLPVNGKPAILFLMDKIFSAGVDSCVVVTGHNREILQNACSSISNIIWGYNPRYSETGMLESAKIGFSLIPDNCSRILLTPADLPLIRSETFRNIIAIDAPLIFPSYQHHRGHPVCISSRFQQDLVSYTGSEGLRGAFRSLRVEPVYYNTDDPYILLDMDSPQDYERILSIAKHEEY